MVWRFPRQLPGHYLRPERGMTPDLFVAGFVTQLRAKAADLKRYCAEAANTCEANASDLENAFQAYALAAVTIPEAAQESGYSEERLREMARKREIPSKKGDGPKGHLTICRRDLPRRPVPVEAPVSDIGVKLMERREKRGLRPAS